MSPKKGGKVSPVAFRFLRDGPVLYCPPNEFQDSQCQLDNLNDHSHGYLLNRFYSPRVRGNSRRLLAPEHESPQELQASAGIDEPVSLFAEEMAALRAKRKG